MGFFSPGESKNWYIGIWYKLPVQTVVWVANRENPMNDKSGAALKITDEGVLVLLNATNGIIWVSPNTTSRSLSFLNPVAQLLDTGNLVIRDENDANSKNFIWESFDHPSDTQLAGMKIGYSFKTGVERYLTTWKSSEDPGPGEYTYCLDPNGYPQLVIKKGREKKYGTGPWVGDNFSGRPSSGSKTPATMYKREQILTEEEVYYHYDLISDLVIIRSVLNQSFRQRLIWNNRTPGWIKYLFAPIDECDEYSKCGPNGFCKITMSPICECLNKFLPRFPESWNMVDWSGGCVRKTSLNCERGHKFLKLKNVKLPDTNSSWFNKTMSLKECKAKCLKNCSCSAFSHLDFRHQGSGCLLWFNELIDMRDMDDAGQEMYVRLASSEIDDSNLKKKVIIAVSLVGIILLGLSLSLYVCKKKAKQKIEIRSKNGTQHEDIEVPFFGLSTIAKATNNFSIDNKLGEGGFGSVYKPRSHRSTLRLKRLPWRIIRMHLIDKDQTAQGKKQGAEVLGILADSPSMVSPPTMVWKKNAQMSNDGHLDHRCWRTVKIPVHSQFTPSTFINDDLANIDVGKALTNDGHLEQRCSSKEKKPVQQDGSAPSIGRQPSMLENSKNSSALPVHSQRPHQRW